jgi:phosphopantothenate-cysteine ligase
MKKILITAGGTREYIDSVRVLTNISTGKLGAEIADLIVSENIFGHSIQEFMNGPEPKYEIYYVYAKGAVRPKRAHKSYEVTDVISLMKVMEELIPQMDVIIHAMAVSDFGFKPANTKLKSNSPIDFIESLKERIFINPKIISYIKKWNPNVKLFSFKFEVGKSHQELVDIAYESLIKNNCDYVIANDKNEMKEKNSHITYLIDRNKNEIFCDGKIEIANEIMKLI